MALRVQRRVPVIGPWLGRTGKKAADNPVIGDRTGFRWLRRAALRTIGGDTYVSVDQAMAVFTASIRRIVAHEEIVLVLRGTDGGRRYPGLSPRQRRHARYAASGPTTR